MPEWIGSEASCFFFLQGYEFSRVLVLICEMTEWPFVFLTGCSRGSEQRSGLSPSVAGLSCQCSPTGGPAAMWRAAGPKFDETKQSAFLVLPEKGSVRLMFCPFRLWAGGLPAAVCVCAFGVCVWPFPARKPIEWGQGGDTVECLIWPHCPLCEGGCGQAGQGPGIGMVSGVISDGEGLVNEVSILTKGF